MDTSLHWIGIRMRFITLVLTTLFIISNGARAASPEDDVSRRKVDMLTIAQCAAKPVVVFENGSRLTFDTWGKVIAPITSEATIFAYNRPGYGKSDEARTRRDGRTIVDELRALLRREGLRPPYVLVGHSLGGLYMQLFARAYPQEVQGLVLVDSLYPGVLKKAADFPLYTRVAKRLFASRAVNDEIDEIYNTEIEMLALPWSGKIPVERLVAEPKGPLPPPLIDLGVLKSDPKLEAAIDGLYPDAHTVIVDSMHRIQEIAPDAVVSAIRRVMPAYAARACGTL